MGKDNTGSKWDSATAPDQLAVDQYDREIDSTGAPISPPSGSRSPSGTKRQKARLEQAKLEQARLEQAKLKQENLDQVPVMTKTPAARAPTPNDGNPPLTEGTRAPSALPITCTWGSATLTAANATPASRPPSPIRLFTTPSPTATNGSGESQLDDLVTKRPIQSFTPG